MQIRSTLGNGNDKTNDKGNAGIPFFRGTPPTKDVIRGTTVVSGTRPGTVVVRSKWSFVVIPCIKRTTNNHHFTRQHFPAPTKQWAHNPLCYVCVSVGIYHVAINAASSVPPPPHSLRTRKRGDAVLVVLYATRTISKILVVPIVLPITIGSWVVLYHPQLSRRFTSSRVQEFRSQDTDRIKTS